MVELTTRRCVIEVIALYSLNISYQNSFYKFRMQFNVIYIKYPTSVVCCLWDGAYKRSLAANRKVVHVAVCPLAEWSFIICPTPYNRK